jgi:sec-independent protein translocase protein TatA
MPSIGPLELGIVLLIVLIVFGPKRLPGLGRQLGSGMREFKDSITGNSKDDDDDGPTELAASADAAEKRTASKASEPDDAVTRPQS